MHLLIVNTQYKMPKTANEDVDFEPTEMLNTSTRSYSQSTINLQNTQNETQQNDNGKAIDCTEYSVMAVESGMNRKRLKTISPSIYRRKCLCFIVVWCLFNSAFSVVLLTLLMKSKGDRQFPAEDSTKTVGCEPCIVSAGTYDNNEELVEGFQTNDVIGRVDINQLPCCGGNSQGRNTKTADSKTSSILFITTTLQPEMDFIGIQAVLRHPLRSNRLEWIASKSGTSSYKTDHIGIQGGMHIQIEEDGRYRITDQLSYVTLKRQFTLTHYIYSRALDSKTHSILRIRKDRIGHRTDDGNVFTTSSLTGTFSLKRGTVVGVYVPSRSIPYLVKDEGANFFSIERLAPL